MATKAFLYSTDRLTVEKTKESRCKSLVNQLLAKAIGKRMYQYLVVRSKEEIAANSEPRKATFEGPLPSHKTPGTKTSGPVTEQSGSGRARIIMANMIAAGR